MPVCNVHGSSPPDGWYQSGACRSCKLEYNRRNKDRINARNRAYWNSHASEISNSRRLAYPGKSELVKERSRKYRENNIDEVRAKDKARQPRRTELSRDRYRNTKNAVLSHYSAGSMSCALCQENRFWSLTIDHMNGDGTKHRNETENSGGVYKWIIKNKFPAGFRVLCWNCNYMAFLKLSAPNGVYKNKTWAKKVKKDVVSHYTSGLNACPCGVSDIDVLTVDHINGGGKKHRRELGFLGGYRFYAWLRRSGYPGGYQILCWNCNSGRSAEMISKKK